MDPSSADDVAELCRRLRKTGLFADSDLEQAREGMNEFVRAQRQRQETRH